MLKKIAVAGLVLIAVMLMAFFIIGISTSRDGDVQFAKYSAITGSALHAEKLTAYPVQSNFRHVGIFPLIDITVTSSRSERIKRCSVLDATMLSCIRMYSLVICPESIYNLPVLSADFIFLPFGKRVCVIEIIDPSPVTNANRRKYTAEMRNGYTALSAFKPSPTRAWYKKFLSDISVHCKATRRDDAVLADAYRSYIVSYAAMIEHAAAVPAAEAMKSRTGIEDYVTALLQNGGPAVDVFKTILGPDGQRQFVRTVMFALP
ncbi:MAG: hypothetical protein HZC28_00555 [Spirochaetes bacterium]|nr:hypothetical protein [Spirochaetota bacterium]